MNTLTHWWQNLPNHIDPVLLSLGSFQIRWYSLGWICAFAAVYFLVQRRLKTEPAFQHITKKVVDDFFFYAVLGVLIGGRLGYVVFYNLGYYLNHPLEIILPFSTDGGVHFTGISGMSFHGGVIVGVAVFIWYVRKKNLKFLPFIELFVPAIPLGYTFGRLGNFMNGELYGRGTDVPWGMYFYEWTTQGRVPMTDLRHPSQLYEALLEGVVSGLILWFLRKKARPGVLFGLYFVTYGAFRFFVEFFRQPDAQFLAERVDGSVFWFMTMGQVLCAAMVVFGIFAILFTAPKRKVP